ncbi:hypothetical protein LDO26_02850 [Luteimonas sp. BDR2-5]|uniref:hypothetical protein n=1 Tax=Proluteimonas luteida TaxID=2878685 RepID=UPI001E645379|nr:hypothetical protein [Luteimonas sp. BDR2-5]MCD9027153.1 hypothetical protein [Luteimonas sp. BDR2-5]
MTGPKRHAIVPLVFAAALFGPPAHASGDGGTDAWWQRLQQLCGHAYAGTLVRAPDGDDTFRDKPVTMHVRDCTPARVRVPLAVGDDLSRTWVFTRTGDAITLSHDHRHEDGTADAVTHYGGTTSNAGSADAQMFPADDHTRRVIPGSGLRSAWLVEIHPGTRFVYAANRVGTTRGFQVDFDLSRPVPAPPAPWGWQD